MKKIVFIFTLLSIILTSCNSDIVQNSFIEETQTTFHTLDIKENSMETTELAYKTTPRQIITFNNGISIEKTIDGKYIYQGDIELNEEQVEALRTTGELSSNNKSVAQTKASFINSHLLAGKRWSKSTVHYILNPSMTQATQQYVKEAIAHWQNVTDIKFIEGYNSHMIVFYNGDGCHSALGMQSGPQEISIDASWGTRGNAIHEIGHAIGLIHEHCSPCRDKYINVNENNIKSNWRSQYKKQDAADFYGDIDFNSIMIYGSTAGSDIAINPDIPIMTKKDGSTWNAQRNGLSPRDIEMINAIY